MVLVLSSQQLSAISAHAEQVYPEECCGLIVGKTAEQSTEQSANTYKQVVRIESLTNQWQQDTAITELTERSNAQSKTQKTQTLTKRRRYSIDPKDMLRVQRTTRQEGLQIIGVYHSHPDHVAVPSECDRTLAWPEYAYIIVSVCEGKSVDVQNWALDSNHQFQPEPINVSSTSAISFSTPC